MPPLVLTINNTLNLVSEGSAPNLRVRQRFHVTVNANGDAPSFTDEAVIVCD